MLGTKIKKVWSLFREFWFAPVSLRRLAIVRWLVGGTLVYLAIFRQFNIAYYDERSLVPREEALELMTEAYRPPVEAFFWPDSWAGGIHSLLLILLVLFTFGLLPRFFTVFAWLIYTGFTERNYGVLFGADYIGGILLLYLALTQHSERFSLKAWCRDRWPNVFSRIWFLQHNTLIRRPTGESPHSWSQALTTIGYRFLQFQLVIIYAYTGFEKLKGASWWDGTALWTVLMNSQLALYDFSFLKAVPLFFPVMTFATLLFEIYFPMAMLVSWLRNPWLLLGLAFHLGIGLSMGLMPFSILMVSAYVLFWDRARWPGPQIENLWKQGGRPRQKNSSKAGSARAPRKRIQALETEAEREPEI